MLGITEKDIKSALLTNLSFVDYCNKKFENIDNRIKELSNCDNLQDKSEVIEKEIEKFLSQIEKRLELLNYLNGVFK